MSIFFTLSGFVIALSYTAWDWKRHPASSLTRLFFYRLARLYPAFLAFAIAIWIRAPKLHDLSDPQTASYVATHLLLWQTWWPMKFDGITANGSAFHVSWSLSTECMLYLLFGLSAIASAAMPPKSYLRVTVSALLVAAGLAALAAAWWLREFVMPAGWNDIDWRYWLFNLSPYARALEFALGVGAYHAFRRPLRPDVARIASEVGGAGLIAVPIASVFGLLSGGIFLVNVIVGSSTALVMIGARSGSFVNRVLSGRAIVYVGTISYSLYLFHFLMPNIISPGYFQTFGPSILPYYAMHFMASLALAIGLATGVYHLIEVPGRRAIRAGADRLLGLRQPAILDEQRAPAE
jgi:peptidoglycan/LPS O-acetylase OafA/YrhL